MADATMTQSCHCGQPLHYSSQQAFEEIQRLVNQYGETIRVTVPGAGTFAVPRHFIALHGLKGHQIDQMGFERVA